MKESLANELRRSFPGLIVRENESMKAHSSFRIGGNADVFLEPSSETEIAMLFKYLHEKDISPVIIGNGTNILVHDEGVRGVVIHVGSAVGAIRAEGNTLSCGAGITLAKLAVYAKEHGLSGLEFAHGIPGTLGGAVMMNAGAYGGEMKDVVKSVRYVDEYGNTFETKELEFGYRKSRFTNSVSLIMNAKICLIEDDPVVIQARMRELWEKRNSSQPLDKPSAGSTFKRPHNGFAAAMIEGAGLKGYTIGGAQVSEKHAGFIINTGNATFSDVIKLMEQVKAVVYQKYQVELEPEVRII